jgi:transcriptional regulator with XRE-family HTH domain
MSQKKLTPSDIEKKSKLPLTSITSILNGTSKNPTIKTLKAISEALDVSLELILSDNQINLNALNMEQLKLYKKSTDALIDIIIDKKYLLSLDKISDMIKEIYEYSNDIVKDNVDSYTIDRHFIDWLIKKN